MVFSNIYRYIFKCKLCILREFEIPSYRKKKAKNKERLKIRAGVVYLLLSHVPLGLSLHLYNTPTSSGHMEKFLFNT